MFDYSAISSIALISIAAFSIALIFWCCCRAGDAADLEHDWRDKYLPTKDRDDG
jgi:hypothetical protein